MKIKNGRLFTLYLTDGGEVYSWGNNNYGQLGIGTVDDKYHKPTKIDFELGIPIKYISAGGRHAAAIDHDNNVYTWGDNDYWLLGDVESRSKPVIIKCLAEKKIEKIYCGAECTFTLTQNGEVYYWSCNNIERLELDGPQCLNVPIKIKFPDNTTIKKLYVGDYHMFAIDTNSKIYSQGDNKYYQLCNGNNIDQHMPIIANMLVDFNIKKIVCLGGSTIILADNKLYSIGYNNYGELGSRLCLNDTYTKDIIQIEIKEGVENVWGNYCTTFCKTTCGDIYSWGNGFHGQHGIGNNVNQCIPVKLNIDLDIKSINYHGLTTYAILNNGEIYTWGLNQLISIKPLLVPTIFTYFLDNDIDAKSMNRTKSARKN